MKCRFIFSFPFPFLCFCFPYLHSFLFLSSSLHLYRISLYFFVLLFIAFHYSIRPIHFFSLLNSPILPQFLSMPFLLRVLPHPSFSFFFASFPYLCSSSALSFLFLSCHVDSLPFPTSFSTSSLVSFPLLSYFSFSFISTATLRFFPSFHFPFLLFLF